MSIDFLNNYSPNDFFYVGANDMPTVTECNNVNAVNCGTIDDSNQLQCITQEKCKNKLLLEQLQKADNGASEKHQNTKDQYNRGLLQMGNLTVGIFGLAYLAYRYRSM